MITQSVDCLHVTHGHCITADTSVVSPFQFLAFRDSLQIGPSALDLQQHFSLRHKFWNDVDDVFLKAARAQQPNFKYEVDEFDERRAFMELMRHWTRRSRIVIWVGDNVGDILMLWWICHIILREATHSHVLHIAAAPSNRTVDISEIEGINEGASPAKSNQINEWALAWEQFACGRFDRIKLHDDVYSDRVLVALLTLLPRRGADAIVLSTFDSMLLSAYQNGPTMANDVVMGKIIQENQWLGSRVVYFRIVNWVSAPVPLLSSCDAHAGVVHGNFGLTKAGNIVLERGFDDLATAAQFAIGGAVAYAPEGTWIVCGEHVEWYSAL